ncbi:hypothetical protein [Streptomyces genisteinicus]|uniref:hypothetical protein n=1 Tax=Streptomyces genisteinicus TaxID=2768068 RepID=UPI0031B6362C
MRHAQDHGTYAPQADGYGYGYGAGSGGAYPPHGPDAAQPYPPAYPADAAQPYPAAYPADAAQPYPAAYPADAAQAPGGGTAYPASGGAGDSFAAPSPAPYPEAGAAPRQYRDPAPHQEPGAAQTWQGETWDTQYQPALTPTRDPHAQAPHAQAPYTPAAHAYTPGAGALPPESGAEPSAAGPAAPGSPAAPAPPADGYGAPTTSGNARITDAQRARAEGRSPIIAPGIQPAGLTAVLGLLLAGGAAVGPYALLVPLVLLQAVTAAGWFRLNGMWPARQGIVLAFAGGLAADAAVLAAGEGHGPTAIIGALGVWVLLTLVLQLRSHAGADERLQGLMATVVSAALAILAAGLLAADPDAVVVGGAAVAAATVARALPLPGAVSLVAALAAGAGAGVAAGGLSGLGTEGALLGLAAAVCALIGLRVASYDYPSRFVHMTAGVALPLTAAVPALYLVGRALV